MYDDITVNSMSKKTKKLFLAVRGEIDLMESEKAAIEMTVKDTFREHRDFYKNISMKDVDDILKLSDNRDDLLDFDFVPRDNNFVTILDPKVCKKKQLEIKKYNDS